MSELIATDYYDVIVGFGATGRSVARYFEKRHVSFVVVDTREDQVIAEQFKQAFPKWEIMMGPLQADLLLNCRRIILSPGVSRKNAVIAKAIQCGIPVIGDIQLFLNESPAPTIAITGSNGKTTVTTLIGNIAKRAGMNVAVGGNIGTPALDLIETNAELNVLELSSFQLESVTKANFHTACVLNVTPDHMDRYESLQEYCFAKQNIYKGANNIVVNRDDLLTIPPLANSVGCASFGMISSEQVGAVNYWFDRDDNWIYRNNKKIVNRSDIKLVGNHNIANAMAVMAIAHMVGIDQNAVLTELAAFEGLPHRCQRVGEKNGVTFINDSKGTNVGASIAAIEGVKDQYDNLVLIAGGEAKNADFSTLGACITRHVNNVVLIGVDANSIKRAISESSVLVVNASSMAEAVDKAYALAQPRGAVLLSPGCASFDMFSSYQDRGKQFINKVAELC